MVLRCALLFYSTEKNKAADSKKSIAKTGYAPMLTIVCDYLENKIGRAHV